MREAAIVNSEAARIITGDAQKYGPGSLMARWAQLWLANHDAEKQPITREEAA
jgi:hypothetical protein